METPKNEKIARVVLLVLFLVFAVFCLTLFGFRPLTSPLAYAAKNGNLVDVKRLVGVEGKLVDQKDIFGKTPLDYAVNEYLSEKNGDLAGVIKYLVARGAKVTRETLDTALLNNNLELAQEIINKGVTVQPDSLVQYIKYQREWDSKTADFLLKSSADIDRLESDRNDDGVFYNALGYAVRYRDLRLVKYLVKKGANVNQPLNTLAIANAEFGRNPVKLHSPGVRIYVVTPPSTEIASYLEAHGAQ